MITSGNEKIFGTPTSLARVALSCLPGTGLAMAWVNGFLSARAIDKIRRSNQELRSQVQVLSMDSNLLNISKDILQIDQIGRSLGDRSEETSNQKEIIVVSAQRGLDSTVLAQKELQKLIKELQHNHTLIEKERIKARRYIKWQGVSTLWTLAMTIGAFSQDLLSKKYTAGICVSCLIILGMDGYILHHTNTISANK